jgi:hypothetical protein
VVDANDGGLDAATRAPGQRRAGSVSFRPRPDHRHYAIAAACWLPVVWIQIRLKQIVAACLASGDPLPARYHRLFRIRFLLGWPAFAG